MIRAILNWLTIGWAALLVSSLISMMAVFMGSGSQDLGGLLGVQIVLLPVALIAIGFYLRYAGRSDREVGAFKTLWRHTPGWLVFVVLSAASLTLIAELTLALIVYHAGGMRPWLEHVPAVSALVYAIALAMGFATLRIGTKR